MTSRSGTRFSLKPLSSSSRTLRLLPSSEGREQIPQKFPLFRGEFAENNVLKPETEAEVIALFESMAQQRAHNS